MERLFQSIGEVIAGDDETQTRLICPQNSSQVSLMAEGRRLVIMGSTVEEAICKVLAQQLAMSPRPISDTTTSTEKEKPPLTLTPRTKGNSNRPGRFCLHGDGLRLHRLLQTSALAVPKSQAAPIRKSDPEVIDIHDADSEDSWGLWGTSSEESFTQILAHLKEKAGR
eukprot:2920090-Amphidinium_carterae.3